MKSKQNAYPGPSDISSTNKNGAADVSTAFRKGFFLSVCQVHDFLGTLPGNREVSEVPFLLSKDIILLSKNPYRFSARKSTRAYISSMIPFTAHS